MNCLECQELLQERLDGQSVPDSQDLDAHLSHCANCRDQHAAALRLLEGLKEMPRPTPRPGFAQAIAATIINDRRQRRDKMRGRVLVTMALAASVLLMLFMAYYWIPRPNENTSVAKDGPKNEQPAPRKEKPPEVEEKKQEPRSPLTPLMDRWADATRNHAKVVFVGTNLDAMEKLQSVENLGPMDPGVLEASQEVSDGVRTVTRNARKAFDFFARELPMPELGEQKN
jgi:hypothetical protein